MNQHKIFRILLLIEILKESPKRIRYICDFLDISYRSVYRYLELFEDLGFDVIKIKSGHYKLEDKKVKQLINNSKMNLTLFQIKSEYQQIVDALVESGGEVTPEIEQSLKINQDQLQEKAINYGYVIKQADYEVDMIDQEIARLQAIKKSREAMVNKLKNTISDAMTLYGIDKIESSMMKLSFRKSETVEIINESLIPSEYLITQPAKISKALIKDSIKLGNEVPGATISTNFNLQIK